MAKLISLAGLPGTGKTTIARLLSRQTGAVYLRIDEIDAVIWKHQPGRDIGPESYDIAAALAASNLELGHHVVVDCVNPWPLTRAIFAAAATRAGAALLKVELSCTDRDAHRRRVESRSVDVPGLARLDWQEVVARDFTPWTQADLRLDTASMTAEDAVRRIRALL